MALAIAAPVAGLPAGPATEATVKGNLGIALTDTTDDEKLALNIDAANAFVAGLRVGQAVPIPTDPDDGQWPATLVLGATLLASRWFKRGNSPAGVVDLGGEAGIGYVQRNDPDIGMMLELGANARPAVG